MEEYNKGDPRSQVARVHKDFYLFLGFFFPYVKSILVS